MATARASATEASAAATVMTKTAKTWPSMGRGESMKRAKMSGGGLSRFLYRRFNASLKLIMPSAYGDKRKLTKDIHYLSADEEDRAIIAQANAEVDSQGRFAEKMVLVRARHNEIEFDRGGAHFRLKVPDEVRVKVELEVDDDKTELEIELSW